MLHEHRFRAMNTEVGAWLWSGSLLAPAWLAEVETFFHRVEAELSRFRPGSALSRLNRAAGCGPQPVPPTLLAVLQLALQAAAASNGLFDPTVLPALQRAGYDRSFEEIAAAEQDGSPRSALPVIGWQRVLLDVEAGTVALPAGMGLDLGGIAKGWVVDRAAEWLGQWGPALVDAGGDMRCVGTVDGQPWPIAVQDPFQPDRDLGILALAKGAVATSSVGGRRWRRGAVVLHHLIDPRTGAPSQSDLHTVTVMAPTAVEAEVVAKVALLLGSTAAGSYVERQGCRGLGFGHDGRRWPLGKGDGLLLDRSEEFTSCCAN